MRTREQVPLQWAATQNNLGNALATLGAREDGTERLEQAVTAYNAALEVRTREQVPLQWAATQNNLGGALQNLGEREDGTERLEQAVTAYNAALEVRTRERVPLDWANTQDNLGDALVFLVVCPRNDFTLAARGQRRAETPDFPGDCGRQCRNATEVELQTCSSDTPLARKIRGVFRFRYRHKSPRVVQVQC